MAHVMTACELQDLVSNHLYLWTRAWWWSHCKAETGRSQRFIPYSCCISRIIKILEIIWVDIYETTPLNFQNITSCINTKLLRKQLEVFRGTFIVQVDTQPSVHYMICTCTCHVMRIQTFSCDSVCLVVQALKTSRVQQECSWLRSGYTERKVLDICWIF